MGLVFDAKETSETLPSVKPILAVVDEEPVIGEENFKMIRFMVDTTFCTYYDAVKCILPAGLNQTAAEEFHYVRSPLPAEEAKFTPVEKLVADYMKDAQTQTEIRDFFSEGDAAARRKAAHRLVHLGILECTDLLRNKIGSKTVRMVRLAENVDPETLSLTPKQREVVAVLQAAGSASEKEAAYHAGVGEGVIKTLAAKGVLEYFDREIYRIPKSIKKEHTDSEEFVLSSEQQKVFEGLRALMMQEEACAALLVGVTGSGKTQVYLRLIESCLAEGRQAMLLVPEISLTPQLLAKFQQFFGEKIAVIHSSLSIGERLDAYKRIQKGDASIVIGTRSGVFAPFSNLGLIILDEEGEHSYKSDSTPRYHARDIAKLRCVYHKALLLLGSATPSIESYYAAQTGRYHLFELKNRFGTASLPEVHLIDMRKEEENGNVSVLSEELLQQLIRNYRNREQSILLINRRGFAAFALCMDCGEPVRCPNCSITLTYHKANGYLMCHYCGYTRQASLSCPSCGGKHLNMVGTGTQKVEDIIAMTLPEAKILRMDTDTVSSRYAYEEKFTQFEMGDYDILVGTQMVAKGLNFPNVTLVGVLNSDQSLYSSDYRCSERTFSLITQVIGRSGRSVKPGRAYIQTLSPENEVIRQAAAQDYESFYQQEIMLRKLNLQPPFCDLAVIGFSGISDDLVHRCAERFCELLRTRILAEQEPMPIVLLGVSQAGIFRLNGKYRYRIILKCKNQKRFRNMLREVFSQAAAQKLFSRISVFVDINGEI